MEKQKKGPLHVVKEYAKKTGLSILAVLALWKTGELFLSKSGPSDKTVITTTEMNVKVEESIPVSVFAQELVKQTTPFHAKNTIDKQKSLTLAGYEIFHDIFGTRDNAKVRVDGTIEFSRKIDNADLANLTPTPYVAAGHQVLVYDSDFLGSMTYDADEASVRDLKLEIDTDSDKMFDMGRYENDIAKLSAYYNGEARDSLTNSSAVAQFENQQRRIDLESKACVSATSNAGAWYVSFMKGKLLKNTLPLCMVIKCSQGGYFVNIPDVTGGVLQKKFDMLPEGTPEQQYKKMIDETKISGTPHKSGVQKIKG